MFIARFKSGVFSGLNATPKTLDEMKAIKVGEDCFAITETQYTNLKEGWDGSESDGVVTVTEPSGWQAEQDMEKWKEDMASFKLSRETEDLITAGSLTMNEYQKTIYDAKVARRAEKP